MKNIALTLLMLLFTFPAFAEEGAKESVYDRVMRTGTIRCGYFVWPPFIAKDPNTGAMSGVFYDLTEELGKRLELKILWEQELNFGTYLQDLETGKYDLECAGGWPTATRGKFASYSRPLFYIALVPFVRADETRFAAGTETMNAPEVKISVIDGENSQIIRRQQFSNAQEVGLPQTASPTEMMMNVLTGKADVTFTDTVFGSQFMKENPGKLKMLWPEAPLKIIPQNLTVKSEEPRFLDMINTAEEEILLDGTVDRILKKHDPSLKSFYPVAKPYESRN